MADNWWDPLFLVQALCVLLLSYLYLWTRPWRPRAASLESGNDNDLSSPLLRLQEDSGIATDEESGRSACRNELWKIRKRCFVWPRQLIVILLIILCVMVPVYSISRHGDGGTRRLDVGEATLLLQAVFWLFVLMTEEAALAADRMCLRILLGLYLLGLALGCLRRPSDVVGEGGLALTLVGLGGAVVAASLVLVEGIMSRWGKEGKGESILFRMLSYPPTPEQGAALLSTCLFW